MKQEIHSNVINLVFIAKQREISLKKSFETHNKRCSMIYVTYFVEVKNVIMLFSVFSIKYLQRYIQASTRLCHDSWLLSDIYLCVATSWFYDSFVAQICSRDLWPNWEIAKNCCFECSREIPLSMNNAFSLPAALSFSFTDTDSKRK